MSDKIATNARMAEQLLYGGSRSGGMTAARNAYMAEAMKVSAGAIRERMRAAERTKMSANIEIAVKHIAT